MKICIISDTHRNYQNLKLPKADILIHCGDISVHDYLDLVDYNTWLGTQKSKYHKIIQIAGNHDFGLEKSGVLQIEATLTNCIYLENNGINIDGIKFWGSPITPQFMNWAFMQQRGEDIKRYWDLIPDDTNVLITHGPPYGFLDQVPKANGDPGDKIGCLDLLHRIKQLEKLKLHAFGHAHSGYGVLKREGLTFINASVMNEEYHTTNSPIVVIM